MNKSINLALLVMVMNVVSPTVFLRASTLPIVFSPFTTLYYSFWKMLFPANKMIINRVNTSRIIGDSFNYYIAYNLEIMKQVTSITLQGCVICNYHMNSTSLKDKDKMR